MLSVRHADVAVLLLWLAHTIVDVLVLVTDDTRVQEPLLTDEIEYVQRLSSWINQQII